MAQIALAWSISKECASPSLLRLCMIPHLTVLCLEVVTAPIVGTTSLKNLEELIGASLPPPEWCGADTYQMRSTSS